MTKNGWFSVWQVLMMARALNLKTALLNLTSRDTEYCTIQQ